MIHAQKKKEVMQIMLHAQGNKSFIAFHKHLLYFSSPYNTCIF